MNNESSGYYLFRALVIKIVSFKGLNPLKSTFPFFKIKLSKLYFKHPKP